MMRVETMQDGRERWYTLKTAPKEEENAARLLSRAAKRDAGAGLYTCLSIPRKKRVFRSGGKLHILEDVMFPGYLFVKTGQPDRLFRELGKARAFPQPLLFEAGRAGGAKVYADMGQAVPLEEADVAFLQDVCGERLQGVMGVTRIILDSENRIVRAEGVLDKYLDRIVKLNLHKRFALVEVELFNRLQPVLFGIRLEQDEKT